MKKKIYDLANKLPLLLPFLILVTTGYAQPFCSATHEQLRFRVFDVTLPVGWATAPTEGTVPWVVDGDDIGPYGGHIGAKWIVFRDTVPAVNNAAYLDSESLSADVEGYGNVELSFYYAFADNAANPNDFAQLSISSDLNPNPSYFNGDTGAWSSTPTTKWLGSTSGNEDGVFRAEIPTKFYDGPNSNLKVRYYYTDGGDGVGLAIDEFRICGIACDLSIVNDDVNVVSATTCDGDGQVGFTLNGNENVDVELYGSNGTSDFLGNFASFGGGIFVIAVPQGTYSSIKINDDSGCYVTQAGPFVIGDPTPFENTSISTTDPTCGKNNGILSVVHDPAIPGTDYTYLWNLNPPRTTQTITGLGGGGTFSVTVTETNSMCDTVLTAMTTQLGGEVTNINVTRDENAGCNSSGIATVTFDASISTTLEWSNGQNAATATGLAQGYNSVTVTSANNCVAIDSVLMNFGAVITLEEVLADHQDNICATDMNGQITVEASGNWIPFTYAWTGPNGGLNGASNNDLGTGVHSITATDRKECTKVIDIAINSTPALTASPPLIIQPSCNGASDGSVVLDLTGGTPPYNYSWIGNGGPYNTESLVNVPAGTYNYTFTDANSCMTTGTAVVGEPAILTATIAMASDVSCNGAADGSIDLEIAGGTAPHTYAWSNGASDQDLSGLGPNTYTCTITDMNGCTTVASSITITEPTALGVSNMNTQPLCNGDSNGSITIDLTGGTPGYTFLWDNNGTTYTTKNLNSIAAGSYAYTFTDGNGCTISNTIALGEPTAVTAAITSFTDILCFEDNTGFLEAEGGGGTVAAAYSYEWSNGETTTQIGSLVAGTYTLTITDDNGCIGTVERTLTQPAAALTTTITATNASCLGVFDGSASVTAMGGTTPYTYLWSNGETTADVTNITVDTYTVTITDANSCTNSVEVIVEANNPLLLSNTPIDMLDCFGDTDGIINIMLSNGSGDYTYEWSNTAVTEDINNLGAGTYSVVVTDDNTACITSGTFVVLQPDEIQNQGDLDLTACEDALITLPENAIGGTGTLDYDWSTGSNQVIAGQSGILTVTDANSCAVDFPFMTSVGASATLINADQDILFMNESTRDFTLDLSQYYYTFGAVSFDWVLTYDLQGVTNNDTGNVLNSVTLSLPDLSNGITAINEYELTINPQLSGNCGRDELVVIIRIIPTVDYDIEAFIPEIFTPNGDGYNDTWQVTEWIPDFENWTYAIFNRNGAEVISNNMSNSWNGQDAAGAEHPDGVYWVVIRDQNNAVRYKGAITKLSR